MFERYAVFYTAPEGPLARFGASWLGWDNRAGCAVPHPQVSRLDVARVTATPRTYGFHGTLKAPFQLAQEGGEAALRAAVVEFGAAHPPVQLDGWQLADLHGFLALRPTGNTDALGDLASAVVRKLDPHRAELTDNYIARRRAAGLSARQDQQLLDWGYPYIFDDFRFHLTLTGRLDADMAQAVMAQLEPLLAPILPRPTKIDAISLMGEAADGMFHELHRATLTG